MLPQSGNTDGLAEHKSKVAFVTPAVTFLTAGLAKLISWDVGWQGIALLIGFAAVGACLQLIPRRSTNWDPALGSSLLTLKQTIATMRVIISIVLVILPIVILSSSKTILQQLPIGIDKYISALTENELQKKRFLVFIPKEGANIEHSLYAGKFVRKVGAGTQPASQIAGELYVLQLASIVDSLVDEVLLPNLHVLESVGLLLAALFVFVVFVMELLGDISWQALKTTEARPPTSTGLQALV